MTTTYTRKATLSRNLANEQRAEADRLAAAGDLFQADRYRQKADGNDLVADGWLRKAAEAA